MKGKKSLKSLVPADADAVGGLEVVSIRLNKGTDGEEVHPEPSEPIVIPSLNRNDSLKLTLNDKPGINAGPGGAHLDAPANTDTDKRSPVEDAGEADLNDIEAFLTAVAAAADTTDIADTDDNADNANGWRGDASHSTAVHDSSSPSTPRKARRRSSLV